MLCSSKILVRPAFSDSLKMFYSQQLNGLQGLRNLLGLAPAPPKSEDDKIKFNLFPEIKPKASPSNISLLTSMSVISNKRSSEVGIIEKVREPGLAYYEWGFLYSRLLPPELQYLCQFESCKLCNKEFSGLSEARDHYMSQQHQAAAATFLDQFFTRSPEERPVRMGHMSPRLWHQMYDRPLPQEMGRLCTQYMCHICDVRFTDNVEMMRHYSRSHHRDSVHEFLADKYQNSPEVLPLRLGRNYWYVAWGGRRLPKELLLRCTPHHCGLCRKTLASKKEADRHYSSEEHTQNTDVFLQLYFEEMGQPPPKRVNRVDVQNWTRKFKHLPPDLLSQCDDAMCRICHVDLPNYGVAKNHYEGNGHTLQVRKYLYDYYTLKRAEVLKKPTEMFTMDI